MNKQQMRKTRFLEETPSTISFTLTAVKSVDSGLSLLTFPSLLHPMQNPNNKMIDNASIPFFNE